MQHMALARLFHARHPHLCQLAHGRGCATKMVLSRITDTVEMHRNIHYHVMIGKRPGREQQATHRAMRTLMIQVDFSEAFNSVDPPIPAKRPQSFPGTRFALAPKLPCTPLCASKAWKPIRQTVCPKGRWPQGTVLASQPSPLQATPLPELLVA
ncbi:LOW QUALITY PROTEIN: hypothetical protein Q4I31_000840 [Leishmania lindenbergi]|uniref:Reverse transcriptase domain-containing protein n=1 Tax=Leishmania lindenbergi TaxID=651832 RepID=A0AAW3AYZ5_9TRYP